MRCLLQVPSVTAHLGRWARNRRKPRGGAVGRDWEAPEHSYNACEVFGGVLCAVWGMAERVTCGLPEALAPDHGPQLK